MLRLVLGTQLFTVSVSSELPSPGCPPQTSGVCSVLTRTAIPGTADTGSERSGNWPEATQLQAGLSEHWEMKTGRTSFWSMRMDWGSGVTSLHVKGPNPSSAPRYWVVSPGGSSGSVRGQWVTQGIGDGGRLGL